MWGKRVLLQYSINICVGVLELLLGKKKLDFLISNYFLH